MKPNELPNDIDERLWLWAAYFRDYRPLGRCRSLEGQYKRHSDDLEAEGVSEESRETPKHPRPRDWVLRAIETQELINQLDRKYRWGLTYVYCYPSLPKFIVLRLMRKYTGRQLGWAKFMELVDIARMRIWTLALDKKPVYKHP